MQHANLFRDHLRRLLMIAALLLANQNSESQQPIDNQSLSPRGDRNLYNEVCAWEDQSCHPWVKVEDSAGKLISSAEPCGQIMSLEWITEELYAVECHINPSVNEYFEMDANTGEEKLHLYGYDFTRSPDRRKVAHAGGVVHFAPPYAQSSYLQVDQTTIYPLREG